LLGAWIKAEEGLVLNERRVGLGIGFRTLVSAGALGTLVLMHAPSVCAQPPAGGHAAQPAPKADLGAAKKHYGEGERKYKTGDYAGALVDFKAANEIKGTAQAERYIGLSEDALGHFSTAAEWYERFLAHVPERMALQGDEIRKRLGEIRALPAKVHIESNPPGASVTVDDKPQSAPTPMDVDLAPGTHVVKLAAPGRLPAQKQVSVTFASMQTVSASLDPEPQAAAAAPPAPEPVAAAAAAPPPPPAETPPPPAPRSLIPAYVTGGLAIAAAGVGTVFGIIALGDKSDFDKNPMSSTADNGDTHALISDMAFGVAITFGVTSAVLFLSKEEPPATSAASARVVAGGSDPTGTGERRPVSTPRAAPVQWMATPIIDRHGGGAGVVVRF
jgi:hypothetical protein